MLKQVSWQTRPRFLVVLLLQSVVLLGFLGQTNGQSIPNTSAPAVVPSAAPQQADTASLYVATAPSSYIVPETLAAPIFPRIPGSFSNKARNAVIDWNVATQWVLREENVTNFAARVFALQSVGVWKAIQANAVLSPEIAANSTAVVAHAAHIILMNMFPKFYAQYDQLFRKQTFGLTQTELAYAEAIAHPAVTEWLGSRLDDGAQSVGLVVPATAPAGVFRNITANANYRSFTQYAASEPMCLSVNQTAELIARVLGPIPYPSDQFNAQYTASSLLGGATSKTRTASQTETVQFWADTGTGLVGHWNQVALGTLPANSTVEYTANLLALLNVAMHDSMCASYQVKFKFNFWRPVTAIQVGDSDHPPDQSWNSLLPTPNNPSYPSSLSSTAGVAEAVLQSFYGTDSYIFGVGSEYGLGTNTLNARFYTSFSDAAKEVVESRYLGGVEFKTDSSAGQSLGQQVAGICATQFDDL